MLKRFIVITYAVVATIILIAAMLMEDYQFILISVLCYAIAFLEERTNLLTVRVISLTILIVFALFCLLYSYFALLNMYQDYRSKEEYKRILEDLSLEELKNLKRDEENKHGPWNGYLYKHSYDDNYLHTGTFYSLDMCLSSSNTKLTAFYNKFTKCICVLKCEKTPCRIESCSY